MLIAVSSAGNNLDSCIDPRFGRCPYFIFVDPETLEYDAVPNPGCNAGGGSGVEAAQEVVNRGAGALITGYCGPHAFGVLAASGVKIYQAPAMIIRKALDLYRQGRLEELTKPAPGRRGPMGRGGW